MKNLTICLLTSLLVSMFTSCGGQDAPESSNSHRSARYTVKLSLGGEFIEQGDEPLSRAIIDSNTEKTYIGINVVAKKDGESSYKRFAYGVFDNPEALKINLMSDYTYRFEVTTLRNATDIFDEQGSTALGKPFFRYIGGVEGSFGVKDMNKFIYSENDYLNHISLGAARVATPSNRKSYQLYNYPRVWRFYGIVDNIKPSGANTTVTLPVNRMNFGIQINVTGLPENTSLTWQHLPSTTKDEDKIQFEDALMTGGTGETLSWEDIYSLYSFSSSTSASQEKILQFTWKRSESVVETHSVKFTPKLNVMKIFNIDFNKINSQSGVTISIDEQSSEMQKDDVTSLEW